MQPGNITSSYLARYRRLTEGAAEPGGAPLPVTGAQRRFLLARQLDPAGRPVLVPLFFAFPAGAVDTERLRAAAGHLAALHPALRTRPLVRRGVPLQVPGDPVGQVDRVRPRAGESAHDALLRTLAEWPVDGPPLRFVLADDGGPQEILAVVIDHTACDEQSLGLITAGLSEAYRDGLGPQDVPSGVAADGTAAYADAVHRQLAAEERASQPEALAYWAERLANLRGGASAPVHAPARPAPGANPGTGTALRRIPVPGDGARSTAFPVLLDACSGAARTLHGPDSVPVLGYPWGGRPPGAAPVLGCFLNTVAHPADDTGLADRASSWWDDLDRADTPFDEVVHAARRAGAPWSGRLDGLLTFEDLGRRPPLRLGDATGRETHIDGRPVQAPFAVSVSYGSDLLVRMAWDRSAVPDHRAEEAFDHLTDALAALATRTAHPAPVG
ncbi:non-ribosomal peptide synthetase [Streptomyces roseifaciens]|uniref:non-ribosomal peptide synthetase n=1 Tax=Streptomyces roseifaciens TaxID=1488406 RepID=UPI0007182C7A|nr:non-ribosomal peptide synthetase [Streptomyces roseifaciens]